MYGQASKKPWEEDWSQSGFQVTPPDPRRPFQLQQEQGQAAAAPYAAPKAAADLARTRIDIQNAPLDAEAKRTSIDSSRNSITNSAIDNEAKLRTEFEQQAAVKEFKSALPKFAAATHARDTPVGDMQIITAWVKTYDPTGAVMTGDVQTAEQAQSAFEKFKGQSAALFDSRGRLIPEVRKNFLDETHTRLQAMADAYRQERSNYENIAGRTPGVNARNVTGDPFQQQFQGAEAAYLGRPVRAPGDQGPVSAATYEGQFGPKPDAPPSMAPEQVRAYDAFLSANPNATPEQLRSFVKGMGFGEITNADEIIKAHKAGAGFRSASEAQLSVDDLRGGKNAEANLLKQHGAGLGNPLAPIAVLSDKMFGAEKADAFARGAADTMTAGFADELGAGAQTLFDDGTMRDNLNRQRSINHFDEKNHPYARAGGQFAGALAMPMGRATGLADMAKMGAAYGGVYGLASSEGGIGSRALGGIEGAAAGGALAPAVGMGGKLFGRGVNRAATAIGRKIAGPADANQLALIEASRQEGVPLNVSDLYPGARNTVSTLETIPGASGPIQRGIAAGRDAIDQRVSNLAGNGTARADMGDVYQNAGRRYIGKSRDQKNSLYDRAERAAGNPAIQAPTAVQRLDGYIGELSQTPESNSTLLGVLTKFRSDLVDRTGGQEVAKPLSISALRGLRSAMREELDTKNLTSSRADTMIQDVLDAASGDIAAGLADKPGALRLYQRADAFYKQRQQHIGDIVTRFIGRKDQPMSSEQTLARVQQMAGPKGDARRLAEMTKNLSAEERADLAATFASQLGRRSTEEPFSPANFISSARQISPNARRLIFGAEGARSVENLIKLSEAKKATVQALNNSRSGQVSNYRAVLSNLVMGVPGGGAIAGAAVGLNGATGVVGGLAISGAGIAASRGLAKLLMNPRFTEALANAPATNSPRAVEAHVGRLRQVVGRDPTLQAAFVEFEDKLLRAVNDNWSRAAASGSEEEERRKRQPRY